MPFRTELEGDTEIINEAGPFAPLVARRGRSSRGKQRTSIEIVSEPLLFDLDEMVLGAKPSEAIRAELEKDAKNITEVASPGTLARRKSAQENPHSPSVRQRYGGGRTGWKEPNQTVRLFNDSNRLSEGFFVRENKQDTTWTVNVPANRFDPVTFVGEGFQLMIARFRALMPILRDSRELLRRDGFNKSVAESVRDMITKGEANGDASSIAKLKQLAAARRRVAMAFVRLGRTIVGV